MGPTQSEPAALSTAHRESAGLREIQVFGARNGRARGLPFSHEGNALLLADRRLSDVWFNGVRGSRPPNF